MGKVIVCIRCREFKQYHAKGLCEPCYMWYYYRKNRERPDAQRREYQRRWVQENREKVNAYRRDYYKNNLEKMKEERQHYYEQHHEERKEYAREYRKENPEKVSMAMRYWRKNNPEKIKVHKERRRATKNLVPNTLTSKEGKMLLKTFPCFYCNSKENLVLDHFVPLSKGGGTTRANIIIADRSCNSRKGTKLPQEILVQLPLFGMEKLYGKSSQY